MVDKLISFICLLCLLKQCLTIPKPDEGSMKAIPGSGELITEKENQYQDNPENQQKFPSGSKLRLQRIIDKIDENKDGFVNLEELKMWIKYTQRRYIDEDVGQVWSMINSENSSTVSWQTYYEKHYGFLDINSRDLQNDEAAMTYTKLVDRDRRRWETADTNSDSVLTRTEFAAFLHPEEHPSMREIVVLETMEDIDKDKNGKISVEEYIRDMYTLSDDEEPEWVQRERDTFANFRDINGDGYLDNEEVRVWIVPENYDTAESEAKHLIYGSDLNSDEQLTNDEILEKFDLFMGSQATGFGEALSRHDEL